MVRSGYAMLTNVKDDLWKYDPDADEIYHGYDLYSVHIPRAIKLSNVPPGTGHDKFLRAIIVQFDLTAPRYFWQEWDTYHFHESISSQSTMHRITKFNLKEMCNDKVDSRIIEILNEYITNYNENPTPENLQKVKSNVPEGLELTRGISTSYAQLKTMFLQRKNHRLPEWSNDFVEFVKDLPMSKELITNEED